MAFRKKLFLSTTLASLTSLSPYLLEGVSAEVTVYAAPGAQATPCIGAVPCDGASFNPVLPNDSSIVSLQTSIPVQLYSGGMDDLSMALSGDFFGFSLELSVTNHLLGTDGTHIDPIFLNLLSTVISRSQDLMIRIGGNSQEQSVLVPDGLEDGNMIEKGATRDSRTGTPELLIAPSLIYAMSNISSMLPTIKWFLGVPFNDTENPRTQIAELAQSVLGDKLVGLQLGNEPDLYHENLLRDSDYNQSTYFTEWGSVLEIYENDENIKNASQFVAPSVCCGGNIGWTPEDVWDTGFLESYSDHLSYISVQHYPLDNCNGSTHYNPQDFISLMYLNHTFTQAENAAYINTTQIASGLGIPVLLFETNTASCGGFSGLSDSFLSALWAIDYAMNMACGNISNTLFHVGGQSNYYNLFTPPSTNQSNFHQWTVGPTFYSSLVVAEFIGNSGQTRVVDLFLNGNNQYTPGYVAYEQGTPQRVILGNFITDPSGASNYTAYISVGGNETGQAGATPGSVQVKYLLADDVNEKFDITWAGQTFGGAFEADGRLQGEETIYTYQCDQTNNVCAVPVPAPAMALVFLSSDALSESEPLSTVTFATTTTATGPANTATVNQAVLATSNGRGGTSWNALGSTSFGSSNDESSSSSGSSSSGTNPRAVVASVLMSGAVSIFGAVYLTCWWR